jgi:chromosome segregation protein
VRIKSLQVHGFKSFVDRTVFTFKDGVTAVVGPNGCGKSNVVDAIRWVMGEQSARRLRGKGMDDVIFAGSETRPPIGMAEVVLTFDNQDGQAPAAYAAFTEIQICRRLYRSGESEYLVNKAATRLKDIQDFFRDTGIGAKGYTIVEQGKVAEIVSAKAEERRLLIEEAAGITKYKARRREAESKIKSTEQNLTRVSDVLGEIRRQINTLERQAKKAARYKRLRETQRVLELSLAADERRDLLTSVDTAKGQLSGLRDAVTALTTQLAERELSVEEKRIALAEAEKAVSAGAEALYALRSEIKNLEGQIELGKREREGIDESNEGRSQELEQLREQLTQAEADAAQAREELEQIEVAVAGQQETVNAAENEAQEARDRQRELERERDAANAAFVEVLTATARGEDRVAALADRRAEIDQRLRSADRDYEEHQSAATAADREQTSLEEGLRNLLAERDRFQEQLVSAMRQHEKAGEKLRDANLALRALRESYEGRNARLDSLREVVGRNEDVGDGTRHLLAKGDDARSRYGLGGLVRELLEVDADVERAVEAVLAERAEALVVAEPGQVVDLMKILREEDAGRGVFLLPSSEELPATGIVPLGEPLHERVRPRAGQEAMARRLLRDVYLVDDLAEAFEVYGGGVMPATFVTRAGDVATPDGIVRGGGEAKHSGALTRIREVRELETEVEALSARVSESEQAQFDAENHQESVSQEMENLRNRHHTAALAVANHEKDLERTAERVKTIGEAQQSRVSERADLLGESEAIGEELTRVEAQLDDAREERGQRQSELDAFGLKLGSAGREVSRLETRVTELRVAHAARVENRDRLQETAERARNASVETREWIERRLREIDSGNERRAELVELQRQAEEQLAIHLEGEEAARIESERLRDAYERQASEVRGLEETVRSVRGDLTGRQEEAAGAELTLRESEMRLGHQEETIRERWGVDLATWEPPVVGADAPTNMGGDAAGELGGGSEGAADSAEAEVAARLQQAAGEGEGVAAMTPEMSGGELQSALRDARRNAELARAPREERERELEAMRKSLQSLGEVNIGAIEEHEELAERFRFLSEQQSDLKETIDSLREAINRINRTSRRRFRETFEAVSKRFSENFPRLFGGGKARLLLSDEAEDILEAGIDIMAMPPGKRLQNVNLLSGGEKTMTALALLVAVFQVRPSPFFLLDEVDAALDDANVGRFNQLITEMAGHSQFLVITHNKRTIEVADVLYGVTMEQKGVSKLVGVELT